MHFCPLRCSRDLTGFMRNTGSMAWNPSLKQGVQLQITNHRGVPPLETFPINGHGSSYPNTGVYSNTTLQGRSLKDSRHVLEKTSRKSFTARKALLIACGVRCVLSPRPSNCSTSSANKDVKDRPGSSPARGERVERQMEGWAVYSGIKRTEERQRARSSIQRERVREHLTRRPSTVPLDNQTGRRAQSTSDIPTCKIVWRKRDDQSLKQEGFQDSAEDHSGDLTPFLHLYLPSSVRPEKQREELVDRQEDSLAMHNKQAVTEEVKVHDVITDSQNQDIAVYEINAEPHDDLTDGIQYDITDTSRHDIAVGVQKENSQSHVTEGKKSQSITDDTRHEDTGEGLTRDNQRDITDIDESYDVPEDGEQNDTGKSKNTYGITRSTVHTKRVNKTSDGKLMSKGRYPAPATALTFPYSLMDGNPSPMVSVLPSFYRTPFGYHIRTFNTPESCSSKTRTRKLYNDIRFVKPLNDMRHAVETKGNPCLLQTKTEGVFCPRPKIMSTERGVPPHKIKTTKTFLWGPGGPQETKTVCELQSPVNRWRSSD